MSWLNEAAEKAHNVVPTVVGSRTERVRLLAGEEPREDKREVDSGKRESEGEEEEEEESVWANASTAAEVIEGSTGHIA